MGAETVERLQADGLTLLAFLANRPDRPLTDRGGASQEQPVDAALLHAAPAEILADPSKLSALVRAVDLLSRRAAPATADTIQMTVAYRGGAALTKANPFRTSGSVLRLVMLWTQAGLLLLGVLAIILLMSAESGRRVVGQLEELRTAFHDVYASLGKLERKTDFEVAFYKNGEQKNLWTVEQFLKLAPDDAGRPGLAAIELCWPLSAKAANKGLASQEQQAAGEYRLLPNGSQAQDLCNRLYQLRLREMIAYSRIAQWNCFAARANPISLIAPGPAEGAPSDDRCARHPHDLKTEELVSSWQRTELRVKETILDLSGYLLPLLLGLIGGGVHVVRRVAEREQAATLAPSEGLSVIGRVILAGIFGGLLAAVFGPADQVKLGNVTLTLAATAFFVGYGLESVLKAVDALIDRVTNGPAPGSDAKQTVPVK